MRLLSVCFLIVLLTSLSAQSQDNVSLQGLIVPNERFVALTGYHGGIQATANHMNRWPGIPATDVLFKVGANVYLPQIRSGVGLSLLRQRESSGYFIANGAEISIAPQFRFDRGALTLGGAYSFQRKELDWVLNPLPERNRDPELSNLWIGSFERNPVSLHQGRFGAAWINQNFMLSTQLNLSVRQRFFTTSKGLQVINFNTYIAKRFPIRSFMSVTPSLSYMVFDDNYNNRYNHLIGALNIRIKKLLVGVQYRWEKEAVIQFGYDFFDRYLISYSYGLTPSEFGTQTLGSHQIGLRFTFNKNHEERALIQNLWVL